VLFTSRPVGLHEGQQLHAQTIFIGHVGVAYLSCWLRTVRPCSFAADQRKRVARRQMLEYFITQCLDCVVSSYESRVRCLAELA
jgi:hypothetical protein